jgi:hypothetical protein
MSTDEPKAKRPRQAIDTTTVPSKDLEESAKVLEAKRDENRKRAERFGVKFVEPNAFVALPRGEALRLIRQKDEGLITGVDVMSEVETTRREARASRFGTSFSYEDAAAKAAGLTDEAIASRKARRERAKKFNKEDDFDIALATAAVEALGTAPVNPDGLELRRNVLHMRGYGYLPAATADVNAFFQNFRPAFIEWLNGVSLNVIFGDEYTAQRALLSFTEPVPAAAGIAAVDTSWKVCLKPLRKIHTDAYAPAGTETTIYLRYAHAGDTKEHAASTSGPKTHGTYSTAGIYSVRNHDMDLEDMVDAGKLLEGEATDASAVLAPRPSVVGVLSGAAFVTSTLTKSLNRTAAAVDDVVDTAARRRSSDPRWVKEPLSGQRRRIVRVIHNELPVEEGCSPGEDTVGAPAAMTLMHLAMPKQHLLLAKKKHNLHPSQDLV